MIDSRNGNIVRMTNVFDVIKNYKKKNVEPVGFIVAKDKIYLSLNNGKLIIPKKCSFENQKLVLIKKTDESSFNQKELINVKFVPLLNENIKH